MAFINKSSKYELKHFTIEEQIIINNLRFQMKQQQGRIILAQLVNDEVEYYEAQFVLHLVWGSFRVRIA